MSLADLLSAIIDRKTAPTFHPFPRLPLELREKIWEAAAQEPRTITLYYQHPWRYNGSTQSRGPLCVECSTSAPPLLLVSVESRCVLLRNHTIKLLKPSDAPVYINITVDKLRIGAYGSLLTNTPTYLMFILELYSRGETLADGTTNPLLTFEDLGSIRKEGRNAIENFEQEGHLFHCRTVPGVSCDCNSWWRKVDLGFLRDPAPGMVVLHGILLVGVLHIAGRAWKAHR